MDDKDIQLAKVVKLFTKFSKDGSRLSEGAVPCCPGGLDNSLGHQRYTEFRSLQFSKSPAIPGLEDLGGWSPVGPWFSGDFPSPNDHRGRHGSNRFLAK